MGVCTNQRDKYLHHQSFRDEFQSQVMAIRASRSSEHSRFQHGPNSATILREDKMIGYNRGKRVA